MRIRFKDIAARVPFLDELRLKFLGGFCAHGIRFVDNSYKITTVVAPGAQEYVDGRKPALFALYHGRLVGLLRMVKQRQRLTMLVSRSRDGEIISRALEYNGFNLARGSPGRRAVEGAKKLVDAARNNQHIAMAVDGPRGPRHEVKPGVIRMAEMTGLPIIPFVARSRSTWWFWGWDRFMGALVWGPTVYLYDEPITVPENASDAEIENIRHHLETRMTALREASDKYWEVVG